MTEFHSFDPLAGHRLPHDPVKAIVAPRPIGWISSVGKDGVNLAPYSFFNLIASEPPLLMFCSESRKDSLNNSFERGEFVYNLATRTQVEAMSQSSARYRPDLDEFAQTGLETHASEAVSPPRVRGAPAAMECKVIEVKTLTDLDGAPVGTDMVIGQVVRVHIDRAYLDENGLFDTVAARTIARCGYRNAYVEVDSIFALDRPRLAADQARS